MEKHDLKAGYIADRPFGGKINELLEVAEKRAMLRKYTTLRAMLPSKCSIEAA